MDTTTSAGRTFLQIRASFAKMEGNVIRQRVRDEHHRHPGARTESGAAPAS